MYKHIMKYVISILVLLALFQSEAKQFTRCELVRELRSHGFPDTKMRDWVCLIEYESSRNTNKTGPVNKDGSKDYGLFQINDKWWCSNTTSPGKDCDVTCNDLLSDDITKATTCAKKIYQRHGFSAWHGWTSYCQGALPETKFC